MVGDDDVYDALFAKYNVLRCSDIDEMVEVAELLAKGIRLKGNRVGIMSVSGGIGVLATDMCIEHGLQVPVFDANTREQIRAIVPFAGVNNPMDPTAQGTDNPEILRQMLEIMVRDSQIDVALLNFGYFLLSEERGPVMADVVTRVAQISSVPVVVTGLYNDQVRRMFQEQGIPVFADLARCIRAISLLVQRKEAPHHTVKSCTSKTVSQTVVADSEWLSLLREHRNLTEYEGKQLLKQFGLPVPAAPVGPP